MRKDILSIIIVHWNTPKKLSKLLYTITHDNQSEIIVVDNASEKKPILIQKEYPGVKLIQNMINRGYSFACNQGTMHAKGEWLLFLNPDLHITQAEINKILSYALKNSLDACCFQSSKKGYDKPLPHILSLLAEFTFLHRAVPLSIFKKKTLFGGGLLIKKEVLKNIGGWDERFFLWFEDSDLTKRLLDHKYRIGFSPFYISHSGGDSFKKLPEQVRRDTFFLSMEIYARKYFSKIEIFIASCVKKKYSTAVLLPMFHNGTTFVVPNMRKDLLDNFLSQNYKKLKNLDELIIVTSALDHRLFWKMKEKYPDIRIICIHKNKGFSPTVNVGLRLARSQWVGTMNDDTTVISEWWNNISPDLQNVGSVNPIIYDVQKNVESAGIRVLKKGKALPQTHIQREEYVRVDATNAACVVYSHFALEKTGLYDESFISYLEDIDLSLRMTKKCFHHYVCNSASVIHQKHSTSQALGRKKRWYDFKNWIKIIIKNWPLSDILKNVKPIVIERMRNVYGYIKTTTTTNNY